MGIEFENLSKQFDGQTVLNGFNLRLKSQGIHCLFGPSGCGKTTLLNLLSGVLKPDAGAVHLGDHERLAYVFQEDRLLPWCTVYENVAFVLQDLPEAIVCERVSHVLRLVELWHVKDQLPSALSGGMKQRVALARAFAYSSTILVMDEPFKGLDLGIKKMLMDYVRQYQRETSNQVIFITHDVEEALYIATDIYLMKGGPLTLLKVFEVGASEQEKDAIRKALVV